MCTPDLNYLSKTEISVTHLAVTVENRSACKFYLLE